MAVDTTLVENQLAVKAYLSRPLALKDKQLATEFLEIQCSTRTAEAERIGCA